MPTHNTPPRDIQSLRKWRAEQAEKQAQRYLEDIGKKELLPQGQPSPAPTIVTPTVSTKVPPTLKKRSKEPGRFPLIGSRAKGGKGQAQEGEKGYTE